MSTRIVRIATKQGHPVPKTAAPARGPFPAELFSSQPVVENYEGVSGNGGPEVPTGGTAQNNYKAVKKYKCKICDEIVLEPHLPSHIC